MIDTKRIKKDFPILQKRINGKPLVYLDSTATSLKPQSVIDAVDRYYDTYTANIFRGIYKISEQATQAYENARETVARFIHSPDPSCVIFTRNTSESINLVAYSYAIPRFQSGDRIAVTIMEHHSNFVPWQQLGGAHGWELDVWNTDDNGELKLTDLDKLITRKTKLLAITAVSNVLGTINPIKKIVRLVKKLNPECLVLVDAAQAVPHMSVDVVDWGADFVAFSSHKMLGPTGVGVLWAGRELLEEMSPYQYGGEMISEVTVNKTIFKEIPHKFEAGTPHIAGVIGLGAAVDYLSHLGMEAIRNHEKEIVSYAMKTLSEIPGMTLYGPKDASLKGGVLAFTLAKIHAHDVAQILDEDNVCIRSGNHCAMPLHTYISAAATARASFYVYTTKEDIDILAQSLLGVIHKFQ